MSAYGIDIPYPPDYDRVQQLREQQDEHVRKSLQWDQIRTDVLTKLALTWMEGEGTLGTIVEQLQDAPVRDRWDLEGYLRYNGARDAKALGQQVLTTIAETVLEAVEAIDDEQPF